MKYIETAQVEEMLRNLRDSSNEHKVFDYPPASLAWLSDSDNRVVSRFRIDFFEEQMLYTLQSKVFETMCSNDF